MRLKRRYIFHISLAVLLSSLATACSISSPAYIQVVEVNPLKWGTADTVRIEVVNKDTVDIKDISVLLRFDETIDRDTISFRIITEAPDGMWTEERIAAGISRPAEVPGDYLEMSVPYRSRVELSQKGIYVFKIVPEESVSGVSSVGIIL